MILESLGVGAYSSALFFICLRWLPQRGLLLLFVFGFLKHFLGYLMGLHELYCKNKCHKEHAIFDPVLGQSILEGLYFMIFAPFAPGPLFIFGADPRGCRSHKYFCVKNCV
jgi:hypothetical protein